ncbi:MAG: MarR family transcriptional regulator [Lachnospiraceae bacterium]|nr:helix-turn-helix domain-containing protein [uncultured Acetatifactor sp.]MCI8286326.1 MarR family transcriptional regulator [Lachnospiraceae bacterium]
MLKRVNIEFTHNFYQAYSIRCKPICRELGMPQTAFDILMFLANNPDYNTAKDIVELRGLKANLVSVNVDRLVRDGYLDRRDFPGDRRKTSLICTEKAQPVIERGRELQNIFFEDIFQDVDEASQRNFHRVMGMMEHNLNQILKESE